MAFSAYIKKKHTVRFHWRNSWVNNHKLLCESFVTVCSISDSEEGFLLCFWSVLYSFLWGEILQMFRNHFTESKLISLVWGEWLTHSLQDFLPAYLDLWLLCSAGVPSRLGLMPECQPSALHTFEVPWEWAWRLIQSYREGGDRGVGRKLWGTQSLWALQIHRESWP